MLDVLTSLPPDRREAGKGDFLWVARQVGVNRNLGRFPRPSPSCLDSSGVNRPAPRAPRHAPDLAAHVFCVQAPVSFANRLHRNKFNHQ